MSIGLGDLDKKRRPRPAKEKHPAGAWAASKVARPWDADGLTNRSTSSRRSTVDRDASIDDAWSLDHAAPLFWMSLKEETRFGRLQANLVAIEDRVLSFLEKPFAVARAIGFRSKRKSRP